MERESDRLDAFESHRTRLFGIAYRMLGTVADAEDVMQESWLRWQQADAGAIRNAEAWLVTVTTRLSIDRLRVAAAERERYVGEWLPEPIATAAPSATDRQAELASDLSLAFLVLLERLAPEERAALLLRDVFDTGYDEIARVLDKTEPATRQIVHRARTRVRGERTRFPVAAETKERLLEQFLAALRADDKAALLALVAEEATWTSDGGGVVPATRRVVRGALRIVRLVLGLEHKWEPLEHAITWLNGEPAIATRHQGRLAFTTSVETDGEQLLAFYRVLNPEKLRAASLPPGGSPPSPE